ncbi:restriction endonuclease, SacI family [Nocardia sp. N2S4-5]|uniref:restriction endonuclease, SacI family n=1 Tax=Nocardia sp. N2S4-5 TaxID=3351565 RepID=UPI0037D4B496
MPIQVSKTAAEAVLRRAFERAISNQLVPSEWEEFSRRTFAMPAKTYTPALGTALLAKATDARVDPLSIKISYGERTYSQRGIGHGVLVRLSQELGFSIRTTTREPLNNQPFFRYDHMSVISRVRDPTEFEVFVEQLAKLEHMNQAEAENALAAFIRVGIEEEARVEIYAAPKGVVTAWDVLKISEQFIADAIDKPRRSQALVAAAFDVGHKHIRSRALNDPSRDLPGDVQAYIADSPVLSVEVRAKPVPKHEVINFIKACAEANISRAFIVVFSAEHVPLSIHELGEYAHLILGVHLTIIESPTELMSHVLAWSDNDIRATTTEFLEAVLQRLKEIESPPQSLARWVELIRETIDSR